MIPFSFGLSSQCLNGVIQYDMFDARHIMFTKHVGEGPLTGEDGHIEPPKTHDEIRQEPYSLPKEFEWSTIDIDDPRQVRIVPWHTGGIIYLTF